MQFKFCKQYKSFKENCTDHAIQPQAIDMSTPVISDNDLLSAGVIVCSPNNYPTNNSSTIVIETVTDTGCKRIFN